MHFLFMTLLLFCCTVANASDGSVSLSSPSQKIKSGSQFYVDVLVENAPEIYGAHLVLNYDATQLEPIDQDQQTPAVQIEHGNFFDTKKLFVLTNSANTKLGKLDYIISQMAPAESVSGSGRIARIFFEAKENATKANITIEKADFGTKDGQSLIFNTNSTLNIEFDATYQVAPTPPTFTYSTTLLVAIVSTLVLVFIIVALRRKRVVKA
ncbi:cohesin domain-containing protein [Pseudoalteromonas luteoviolacea]|uniref:cohesin domain-containing protein n=1 Tax=Pseudoalteromonas luteoviolacea TaxID=43657 RepID=UPI001F22FC7C|nr:cohesin domain-containing protein [Pseudoalteromonas luteoviolacea]MCF6441395.1 cohesin domain-containing protein [Pseudoalteromonas luteoviolacea]